LSPIDRSPIVFRARCNHIYIPPPQSHTGDCLKKLVSLLIALFCVAFCFMGLCAAESEDEDVVAEEVLMYDGGFVSDLYTSSLLVDVAETVKFTPNRVPWTLTKVQIVGWNGFDNETLPPERVVYLEIRDKNLDLLYQFSDSHLPYFTDVMAVLTEIEIPPLTVNDDFYVCFYDRGAVKVGYNVTETDNQRSYRYNRFSGDLIPVRVGIEESEGSLPADWIIRAVGH